MDAFDNCRICLGEINHEPIKITRLILRFLEINLQLRNVGKPNSTENVKQNLCAPCFNRISEFQEFIEQCKDADEFWKSQFDDLKETSFNKQIKFNKTELVHSFNDDTTVPTTEVQSTICYTQPEEKGYKDDVHSTVFEMEQGLQVNEENEEILLPNSSEITDEEETTQIEDLNSIDLTNWTDDTNDANGEIPSNSESGVIANDESEEIIEYEYQIDDEIETTAKTDDAENSDTSGVDYRCFGYEKVETKEEALEEHTETTHNNFFLTTSIDENGKLKMTYKCPKCDKTFNRIYDIESHYNIHIGAKPFTCNVCGKSFRQKNILTTHQTLHFGKKIECEECGKKFARRSQLILHNRMHRDEKPFVCDIDGCGAAFRQRKQLIDHSHIHTGEKNFQCQTCTKAFHTRKRLQDHMYKVHSQYRYRCELCGKTFLKPHMIKHHMITAHNVELDDVSHLKTNVDIVKRK